MKAALQALATELGFDLCRVSRETVPPHAPEFLQWLEAGRAGEMSWLERNKDRRTNPELVLPGVRSVIVLAMNYWQGGQSEAPLQGQARVARYAWGTDYHGLIEKKLEHLDRFLQQHGGRQRCYVDTGPVLERDFAARAGLGWQGKSTMLIHRRLGTWFFLAAILTTLDLEPDLPERDHCGTCSRCMEACPTRAINAPHQLDARRCISYLTIELKGSIPEEFRPLIGDRVYGCDECLTACPWNRFARASKEAAFTAPPELSAMPLRETLTLSDEEFRALFRHSPIKRIKRRGFLRNVCVVLGNIGTEADLPALERAAGDPEPLIAEHATWAIGRIRSRVGSFEGCTRFCD